jgi:hypothetical protein
MLAPSKIDSTASAQLTTRLSINSPLQNKLKSPEIRFIFESNLSAYTIGQALDVSCTNDRNASSRQFDLAQNQGHISVLNQFYTRYCRAPYKELQDNLNLNSSGGT